LVREDWPSQLYFLAGWCIRCLSCYPSHKCLHSWSWQRTACMYYSSNCSTTRNRL